MESREDEDCLICKGSGLITERRFLFLKKWRFCPACDGKGSTARTLREPPDFKPEAKVVREIPRVIIGGRLRSILIMDDARFRVYHPDEFPKDPNRRHFAVGMVRDKNDEEIKINANLLLSSNKTKFFHEDGTLHQ